MIRRFTIVSIVNTSVVLQSSKYHVQSAGIEDVVRQRENAACQVADR
jgi:hypothetical protein